MNVSKKETSKIKYAYMFYFIHFFIQNICIHYRFFQFLSMRKIKWKNKIHAFFNFNFNFNTIAVLVGR